jgi:hypothetical protein
MPNANRPSGPGKPTQERRDVVAEREELEQIAGAGQSGSSPKSRSDGLAAPSFQ